MKNFGKELLFRLRSRATLAAIAGAVWLLLSAFGVPERIGLTSDAWNTVLRAVGTLLCAFGIVNNPSDRENF